MTKTILFLGSTGGVALSALRRSLSANHTCIALVRTPSKLTALLPSPPPSNLHIIQGNAHDVPALAKAVVSPSNPTQLVDTIVSSIGGAFNFSNLSIDDPHVCERGIEALVAALKQARESGASGKPHIVVVSTTGITKTGIRDVPLLMVPLYHLMLKQPHKDKEALEKGVAASGERFTTVRPSLLTDGGEDAAGVRVGVEDVVKGEVESKAVGYTVSREDVGKWVFEEVVEGDENRWNGKAVTISY
ncbi:hypothetical protein QBC34DRAFT_485367 [Podospora aff. communis PSN243]|uniref:NAD(P)-binding domain-containing protein n=1 Tax=Podospora aff. communis PSN243 TaxID=3040156 RepID=A0AAV9GQP8_9PEZI|nr:hypothetical protein QBC34DRAFT_485367 [Podospora aff. communis PSN243]